MRVISGTHADGERIKEELGKRQSEVVSRFAAAFNEALAQNRIKPSEPPREKMFTPREDIIKILQVGMPTTRRCRSCSAAIGSGELCSSCMKKAAAAAYGL